MSYGGREKARCGSFPEAVKAKAHACNQRLGNKSRERIIGGGFLAASACMRVIRGNMGKFDRSRTHLNRRAKIIYALSIGMEGVIYYHVIEHNW
jgi:hypothetical protein